MVSAGLFFFSRAEEHCRGSVGPAFRENYIMIQGRVLNDNSFLISGSPDVTGKKITLIIMFVLLGFCLAGTLHYIVRGGTYQTDYIFPQVQAGLRIMHEVTRFHQVADELIHGEKKISEEEVFDPYHRANNYIEALLQGGIVSGLAVPALVDDRAREYVREIKRLNKLLVGAAMDRGSSTVRMEMDEEKFNVLAEEITDNSEKLVRYLDEYFRQEVSHLVTVSYTLVAGIVVFVVLVLWWLLKMEDRAEFQNRKIADNEARLKSIIGSMSEGMVLVDDDGIVLSMNPAAEDIFGYMEGEMLGSSVKALMGAGVREYWGERRFCEYVVSDEFGGLGCPVEGRGARKNGREFPLEIIVSRLDGDHGDHGDLYIGLLRDITERKRIETMKNEFVSTVSHELRTPLTSIRGALSLIAGMEEIHLPYKIVSLLDIAHNNTERLLLLINDILDIQKIESGNMLFRFEDIDIVELVDLAVKANSHFAEKNRVSFRFENSLSGNRRVNGDGDRLMQVMNNLMSNAAKYSRQGDTVDISVAEHGKGIRVSVTDYGNGIPEGFRARIFEKFTQADSSDTRKVGGTGLGLSIAQAIVEKHGGKIGFVSHEGIGTTMYFDLPGRLGGERKNGMFSESRDNDRAERILVIEDDRDVAALLQRMIIEAGFEVDIACSLGEARAMLAEPRYACITLDLILPDENGGVLLSEIRSSPELSETRVIVVSVIADEARRELSGGAINVIDWLQKPVDRSKLEHALKRVEDMNEKPAILHVEDDESIRMLVGNLIGTSANYHGVGTVHDAREALLRAHYELVMLDVSLPDGDGLELIRYIDTRNGESPRIVVFSASELNAEKAEMFDDVLVKSKVDNDTLKKVIISNLPGKKYAA